MKKSAIWMLALVMAFAFAGLLYIQVTYIRTIMATYSQQFNTTVSQCLLRVSRDLELKETLKFIEEDIKRDPTAFMHQDAPDAKKIGQAISELKIKEEEQSWHIEFSFGKGLSDTPPPLIPQKKTQSIQATADDIRKQFLYRYQYQRALVDEVVLEMMRVAHHIPIEQRIDFNELNSSIHAELAKNELNLPFVFFIINSDENIVYQSEKIQKKPKPTEVITQGLFPKDLPSKLNYIKIYFPTKLDYLFNSISFIIPSVIFTLILLITFTFTLVIIFRQKRLSEMKNDFINNMTHELKTPVSTISLAAQMLKDSGITKSPDVFKHISGVINDETRRLGFLVEKVLQMSLFENQKAALKLKEIDANDLLAGIANTFTIKAQKYGGDIDIDLQAEESTIYVDEMHITNVLFNLLDNAVKYRQQDVPLKLIARTWNEGEKLQISIEDNGVGIKKEYLKKVFDRFFRVPTGNVHDVKGFGLGLAYVRKIVEDHNGIIRAEAGENNIGTKFIITLPLIKN